MGEYLGHIQLCSGLFPGSLLITPGSDMESNWVSLVQSLNTLYSLRPLKFGEVGFAQMCSGLIPPSKTADFTQGNICIAS